ncbi:hypothetical protein [Aeromonas sp. SG16]|uniref:hypothetical protein n=1 Tax=Aeromonas sp. SG16 TaxID=2950548 RepID=UPI0021096A7E|nr:hypothetical protein [Aeromonas sp. SG16]MCQ4053080.1 hypothetical protein [Aeromonas sp. SG16]
MEKMNPNEEFMRQQRLSQLIHGYFGGDNDYVVEAIAEMTGQKVTVRSIQAWLISPKKVSYRRVPDWALNGLEEYVQQPGKAEKLREYRELLNTRRFQGGDPVTETRRNTAVECATREIELSEYQQRQWVDTFGQSQGKMLYERFNKLENDLSSLSSAFGLVLRAIDESQDIEQLKTKVNDYIRTRSLSQHYVRLAREDIERGSAEFSNAEGIPTPKTA